MKYMCFDEFLSCKMEEFPCLELHLVRMAAIHRSLTQDMDYEMTDDFAIHVVLRSLTQSYNKVVEGVVMKGESVTFMQFMMRLRNVKVEPIEGELID